MDGTGSGLCPVAYICSGLTNFLVVLPVSAGCNISLNVTLGSCTAQCSRASTFHTMSWTKCDQSSLLLVAA